MDSLSHKFQEGEAVVCVVGLGYVGVPLALALASKFTVYGLDSDPGVVRQLRNGVPHVENVAPEDLRRRLHESFFPTLDASVLDSADVVIITVPTPLNRRDKPELRHIREVLEVLGPRVHRDQLIVLESTTFPGTVDDVVVPILERGSGLTSGSDFLVAFSPERINPGGEQELTGIPKVVGGIDSQSTAMAELFYSQVFDEVVSVRDAKTAEATKMLESVFRLVNIALVNELALIYEKLGVDIWEAIEAAKTKPFGYLPFYPGPGVGGHCVPIDPFYLHYKAQQHGAQSRFIELAKHINEFMVMHVVRLLEKGLEAAGKPLDGADVAVLGLSYKPGLGDTRGTPARDLIEELRSRGCHVRAWDQVVRRLETDDGPLDTDLPFSEGLRGADAAVLLLEDLDGLKKDLSQSLPLMNSPPVLVDTRNVFRVPPPGTIYMGLGKPLDGHPVSIDRSPDFELIRE